MHFLLNVYQVLMEWIDDVLVDHRIIVKDIKEDLFDGQVLQKLLEKLGDVKLQVEYGIPTFSIIWTAAAAHCLDIAMKYKI